MRGSGDATRVTAARKVTEITSWGRVAAGAVTFLWPAALTRPLGLDPVTAARIGWVVRLFAARETAIGAGTLLAVRSGGDVRPWLYAAAVGDGGDSAAFVAATRRGHLHPAVGVGLGILSASGLLADLLAARELADD